MQIIPSIYCIKITYCVDHWMPKLSTHWLLFYIFAYYSRKIQSIAFIIWQPFKRRFLHSARCRMQNQDLFSGLRSVQTSKTKLVFWTSQRAEFKITLRNAKTKSAFGFCTLRSVKTRSVFGFWTLQSAKTNFVFGVCTLHSAKTKSVFGLCTLRSGHSKLVFCTLHTAERKISICFCILQRNES